MFNNLGFGPNRFLFRRRLGPRLAPAFGGGIGGPGNDIITVNNGGGFTGCITPVTSDVVIKNQKQHIK
jgi:hypothetical protein